MKGQFTQKLFDRAVSDHTELSKLGMIPKSSLFILEIIAEAIQTKDNQKIGDAYLQALFNIPKDLDNLGFCKKIIETLKGIKNGTIDSGNFTLGSTLPGAITEKMQHVISQDAIDYLVTNNKKINEIAKLLTEFNSQNNCEQILKQINNQIQTITHSINSTNPDITKAIKQLDSSIVSLISKFNDIESKIPLDELSSIKQNLLSVKNILNTIKESTPKQNIEVPLNELRQNMSTIKDYLELKNTGLYTFARVKKLAYEHPWATAGLFAIVAVAVTGGLYLAFYYAKTKGIREGEEQGYQRAQQILLGQRLNKISQNKERGEINNEKEEGEEEIKQNSNN